MCSTHIPTNMAMAGPEGTEMETFINFDERLQGLQNSAYAYISITLGSRLGLFDKLAALGEPRTLADIAREVGMKARYMEEWLGSMVCAGIVEVHERDGQDLYYLPQHRVAHLTRNPDLLKFGWLLPCIVPVFEELLQCFPQGGPPGIPYSSFKNYCMYRDAVMEMDYTEESLKEKFDKIPGLPEKLQAGVRVLGIGCSVGTAEICLAAMYPRSSILGIDIDESAIQSAAKKSQSKNLTNVNFAVQDICAMPTEWVESWDVVLAFSVIHDLSYPSRCLTEISRVLRKDGLLVIQDTFLHNRILDNKKVPGAVTDYTVSLFHCMAVSLYQERGVGLGCTWSVEQAKKLCQDSGLQVFQELHRENNDLPYCLLGRKLRHDEKR